MKFGAAAVLLAGVCLQGQERGSGRDAGVHRDQRHTIQFNPELTGL